MRGAFKWGTGERFGMMEMVYILMVMVVTRHVKFSKLFEYTLKMSACLTQYITLHYILCKIYNKNDD